MTWTELIVCSVVAYMIGAIPFSWLFVRVLKGVDLRTVGSGNLGSTNAMRVLGTPLGLAIQALDILKGWLPAFLAQYVRGAGPPPFEYAVLAIGLSAILGHMFPVYLRFRGGKGVNTSLGVFLALAPKATFVALAVGVAVLALTRYVSLGSMTGAVVFPLAVWFFYGGENVALIAVAMLVGLLVIFMHGPNIRRLLAGTEASLSKTIHEEESGEKKPGRQ
jgi:glycerol-3-phosphate acyltransferase PlsY